MSHRSIIFLLSVFVVLATPATADGMIAGQAFVTSGDTIGIEGEQIRILGIDAPELEQTCVARRDAIVWPCGRQAALALSEWLSHHTVKCQTYGTDWHGRWQANCDVDTVSVATWMAGNGWAVPNQDCQCKEVRVWAAFAKERKLGLWDSEFLPPWEWRKRN